MGRPQGRKNKTYRELNKIDSVDFSQLTKVGRTARFNTELESYQAHDTVKSLIFAMIQRATEDARGGNLEALIWLLVYGIAITNEVTGSDYTEVIQETCREIWERIMAGEVETDYSVSYLSNSKSFQYLRQDLTYQDD